MSYPINSTVREIGQIAIEGNIIPNEWYHHLRNEKGKIQTNAALILADIVYWHRPIPIYDLNNGELIGYSKKFKDDLLQLGYKYFKNKFGFTEVQSRNALIFLERKGFIFREFREIKVGHYVLNNVMYIGIYSKKISTITGKVDNCPLSLNANIELPFLQITESQNQSPKLLLQQPKPKQKDWTAKFTDEQKAFLDYLLNINPEVGNPIEKSHATWWIKSFGVEKVKIALRVYLQRVEMAKKDSTVPMPQHIGKYIRKALNDGLFPSTSNEASTHQESVLPPSSQKSKQGGIKNKPGPQKNETTNTQISMMSLFINEINDKSVTFQKEEIQAARQEEPKKEEAAKQKVNEPTPKRQTSHQKKNKSPDWKASFTVDERKLLSFLLSIVPAKGDSIEEKHATWWIKHFGIMKIEVALQVYWQQVQKAKQDSKVPMPASIGAYVREALNKGTQPFSVAGQRNKAFAEQFKRREGLSGLTITEKYCRFEELGKEWYYNMQEETFQESLRSTFKNYSSQYERVRQTCVALNDKIPPIQEKLEKSEYDNNDRELMTLQKEIQAASKEESKKEGEAKQPLNEPTPKRETSHQKKNESPDWKASFTVDERKFLTFLLSIVPAKGESIEEEQATWWIKHFGVVKIKVALQVYWQQVEKAKNDLEVPMPAIGAYVREALDKGRQLCRELEHRNKAFSEEFKAQVGWGGLMITEKYCQVEGFGQKLYYNLPEALFKDSLRSKFENYCSYGEKERQSCVA